MCKLIITEKPSVARDIAGAIGRFERKDGYFESKEYIITWAFGHLLKLSEPADYNPVWAKWDLTHLPIIPEQFKTTPFENSVDQLRVIQRLLASDSITEVINACDAGREGELIARRILEYCQCKKPIKRLWLSESTPAAIRSAFNNLRDGQEFDNLGDAAAARSFADWLVGINGSRAFSVRHNAKLSIGRVQTPTLALIVGREKEIRDFRPQQYWELHGTFEYGTSDFKGIWMNGQEKRLHQRDQVNALLERIKGSTTGVIDSVDQRESREQPPTLFNLNDLQKEANRRYSMTAQQTLDAAQNLYEKHKLLTYPRTDSRHLTNAMVETLDARLAALKLVPEYNPLVPTEIPSLGKRYVNDQKVTDHHAIIVTTSRPVLSDLKQNEQRIYDLVARRFMAIFFSDSLYHVTRVVTLVAGESFMSKGKVELNPGWKAVYRNDEEEQEDNQELPALNKGDMVNVTDINALDKQTKPPKRYTDATLLSAMENAGRLTEDDVIAEALSAGIGTPATRASMIEHLLKIGYITREKKVLIPTPKGETLIDLVPDKVKSVELTGEWEDGLKQIEQGTRGHDEWLEGIISFTREVVSLAKEQPVSEGVKQEGQSIGICPVCGKNIIEGQKGYGCSGYKEGGCKFVVWKEIAKKKITLRQAQDLLEKGKTSVIKGFKSKQGKSFDAILVLVDGQVKFEFPEKKPVGKCPVCGKDIIEGRKGYGCSGYKEGGCKFVIWKEIAKKKITLKQAQDLLEKGKTGVIKGFKSKQGKDFSAALALVENEVRFDF